MSRRTPALLAALSLAATGVLAGGVTPTQAAPAGFRQAQPTGAAPGGPGTKTVWSEADKAGFGTARARGSNVWFTLQQGRISEVFYPDLSTPSMRNLELVVTDGRTFTDRESTDMRHGVARPDARSLRFTQVNTDKGGHYRIVKSIVTDPRRDSVVLRVRLRVARRAGSTSSTRCTTRPSATTGRTTAARTSGNALVAHGRVAPAARWCRGPAFDRDLERLRRHGSDGWRDLEAHHRLDQAYAERRAGQRRPGRPGRRRDRDGPGTAPRRWPSASAGRRRSRSVRRPTSAGTSYARPRRRYDRGWHRYLGRLTRRAGQRGRRAAAVPRLRAGARRRRGQAAPRGVRRLAAARRGSGATTSTDLSSPSGAYHLVWSRDAYQFGTALWADGDKAAARRIVDWLFTAQQKPDGSFPQNSDVTGKPVWTDLQLDEVALPIVLAHLVGRDRRGDLRAREEGRRLPRRLPRRGHRPARRRTRRRSAGRTSPATRRTRSPPRSTGWCARPTSPARNGDTASGDALARAGRRVAGQGEGLDRDHATARSAPAVLPAADQGRRPERGHDVRHRRRRAVAGRPAAVVDPSFLDLVGYGIEPPTTRPCAPRCAWSTTS